MYAVTVLALSVVLQGPAAGKGAPRDTGKPATGESQAEFLWTGMVDGLQRQQSGQYRAHGRMLDDDPTFGRLEGDVELFGAFDHGKNLFRFDRREPTRE